MPELLVFPIWFAALVLVGCLGVPVLLGWTIRGLVRRVRESDRRLQLATETVDRATTHLAGQLAQKAPPSIRKFLDLGLAVLATSPDARAGLLVLDGSDPRTRFSDGDDARFLRMADQCLASPGFRSILVPAVVMHLAASASRAETGRATSAELLRASFDEDHLATIVAGILRLGHAEVERFAHRSATPAAIREGEATSPLVSRAGTATVVDVDSPARAD